MRFFHLAAVLTATGSGLLARPARAADVAAPAIPDPVQPFPPAAVTAPAVDAAEVRDLREQLFAQAALRLEGSRVMRGDLPVRATTFYALIGRPDLSAQIRARRATRIIVTTAGAVAMAIGFTWGVLDGIGTGVDNTLSRPLSCGTADTRPECADKAQASPFPWLIGAAGAVTMVTGLVLPTDPVGRDEKEALIRDYNGRLRTRMGLAGALETAARTTRVSAAVQPDGQSGMLLAGCAF